MLLSRPVQGLYMLLGAGFWGSLWSDFGLILAPWGLRLCTGYIAALLQSSEDGAAGLFREPCASRVKE